MLPAEQRLRRSAEFSAVVRQGRRVSRPLLTVHLLTATGSAGQPAGRPAGSAAGLVVSKTVGNSVVRHRTSRRLRHLLRDRLPELPGGTRVVVRAAPAAGTASSAELDGSLSAALAEALIRSERSRTHRSGSPAPRRST